MSLWYSDVDGKFRKRVPGFSPMGRYTLVICKNKIIRELYVTNLEARGVQARGTPTLQAAKALDASEPPRVVIVCLLKEHSLTMLDELRSIKLFRGAKLVFIGYENPLEANIIWFYHPVDFPQLAQTVAQLHEGESSC